MPMQIELLDFENSYCTLYMHTVKEPVPIWTIEIYSYLFVLAYMNIFLHIKDKFPRAHRLINFEFFSYACKKDFHILKCMGVWCCEHVPHNLVLQIYTVRKIL
jgi:hypothetical protein